MLRAGRTGFLKGCTCLQAPRAAPYSTASTSKNAEESPEALERSKVQAAPSVVYTRPQDAYDPLFADIPPAPSRAWSSASSSSSNAPPSSFNRPPPLQPFTHPTTTRASARAPLQQARPQQKQTLTKQEAQTFAELLNAILPNATPGSRMGESIFGAGKKEAAEKVQEALRRKVGGKKVGGVAQMRRSKAELSDREVEELDRMREVMVGFESDLELLKWSMVEVFGFEHNHLFPDLSLATNLSQPPPPRAPPAEATSASLPLPRGPSSPIYSDLLLILFLLLRDTYRSPQLALHIFALASSSPYSYVQGCHTALYNEVLRTRWMEGDVESVAQGVEEMRSAGVRMDSKTREIVDAIGQAIRVDEERVEARLMVYRQEMEEAALSAAEESASAPILTPGKEDALIKRYRFFGSHQARAWGKMEKAVEENQEETLLHQQRAQDERWMESESRRARFDVQEREQAERQRPNLFFGADSPPRRPTYHSDAPAPPRQPFPSFDAADPAWDDPSHSLPPSFFGRRGRFSSAWDTGSTEPIKRPSFANPYKIRRQGKTREEKARRNVQHPLMARR